MQKKNLRVLVVCESSGVVRRAFRALGHTAFSCDLLPSADNSPQYHFQCDAFEAINSWSWDLIIMHPPCTYLSVSGIHWNDRKRGWEKTEQALEFVRKLMECRIPWALENPVSIISSRIRKPDQIIQPYEFGHNASKKTCLWLNGLPKLVPTQRVYGRIVTLPSGKIVERWANQTDSGQNRLTPSPDRWQKRSVTYEGIAAAMANQWGSYLTNQ